MDVCPWLKYRVCSIRGKKSARIPLRDMQSIFYSGFAKDSRRQVHYKPKNDLAAVKKVSDFGWAAKLEPRHFVL